MRNKLIIVLWIFSFILLFLYSFVQIDLGLTFSKASIFQTIERSFQYIGYFNRPLSTYLFAGLVAILSSLYLWTLSLSMREKIKARTLWIIIFSASAILLFSYCAFSYDLFNYIFDAKIVTHYHQNPYEHKALDYPGDPMLGFMHWTHRTYPYGPAWLGVTIPLSYLGLGYFIITFYLFKALIVGSYLLACFLISKIAKQTKIIEEEQALAFFALNPLIIVETLVSGHHDMVMMATALLGVYLLFKQKKLTPYFSLAFSAGIKFATILLSPIFIWYQFSKDKEKYTLFFIYSTVVMTGAVVLASYRTTFQPWYLIFVFPFCTFLIKRYYVFIPSIVITCLALLQYIPFLYAGNFDPPIPSIMNQILLWSIVLALIFTLFARFMKFNKE